VTGRFRVLLLPAAVLGGLRARASLTVGCIVLAAVAVASAVLGPAYQDASLQSFLVTRLKQTEPYLAGVSLNYRPDGELAADPAAAADHVRTVGAAGLDRYDDPTTSLVSHHDGVQHVFGLPDIYTGFAVLRAQAGACAHLRVQGSCPNRPGEVLMFTADADAVNVRIGDSLPFAGYPGRLRVVGLYTVPEDTSFWYDDSRLAAVQPTPSPGGVGITFKPGPLITDSSTFDRLAPATWSLDVDRTLRVTPDIAPADVRAARRQAVALPASVKGAEGGHYTVRQDNALQYVIAEIDQNRETARKTVAPAVVSLVLVALALLVRLLAAAAEQRRSELALGSLRGMNRRQMWVLGMAEPLTLLLIAAPLGLALGYAAAVWLAHLWLVDDIPVPFGAPSVIAAVLVLGLAVVGCVWTVARALADPLSSQLAGVRRPGRSGRLAFVAKTVLVVGAVVVTVSSATAKGRSDPETSDLALPLLLAGGAGLLVAAATVFVARWWSRRTSEQRGIARFVASRAVSRRTEGSLVILPLTAALAIAVFAGGVFGAASAWRASEAATQVGADVSYRSTANLADTVAMTHRLDPDGRWLMAAGVVIQADYGEKLVIDAPRLGRVGAWPSTWTPGQDGADVAALLGPKSSGVELRGRTFRLSVVNDVDTGTPGVGIGIQVRSSDERDHTLFFGPFPTGSSTDSVRARYCETGCQVRTLLIGGPATDATTLNGTLEVSALTADGTPVESMVDSARWRPVISPLGIYPDTTSIRSGSGPGLRIALDSRGEQALGAVSPDDVPAYRPVLMGRSEATKIEGGSGDHLVAKTDALDGLPIHVVGETESMPFLGPRGFVIDYTMMTRDQSIPDSATEVYVLARGDTPDSITAALRAHGAFDRTELGAAKHLLDQDAYALSLNLYLVVALATMVLAAAGLAVNTAVQLPERRRDAASLRVVGVRRPQILRAVFAEFCAVLGAAGLAGIAAGALAQYLVVRTVTLGFADDIRTPRVVPTLDLSRLAELVGVAVAVMVMVATLVAALTVQHARAATLRETTR
jgi:hypothetical protein